MLLESNKKPLFKIPSLDAIKNKRTWSGLKGSAKALAISRAAEQGRPLLLVTPDTASAAHITHELRFFLKPNNTTPVLHFPDWETLPYDHFSPHDDIVSARLQSLHALTQLQKGVVVAPITTLMTQLPPKSHLQKYSLLLKNGDEFDIKGMRLQLEEAGYRCVDTVYEHGEFAVRGSLFDLYPMGSPLPYRIDLFDDTIDSLRTFDPETQRTIEQTGSVNLLPAREYPLDDDGIRQFRNQWHQRFNVDHRQCALYQDISDGVAPAGIEYYLPLFFEKTVSLFDYLPANTCIFSLAGLEHAGDHYWREINNRYESRSGDLQRPILAPTELFFPISDVFNKIKSFNHISLIDDHPNDLPPAQNETLFSTQQLPTLAIDGQSNEPLLNIENFINQHSYRLLFCVESAGRREALLDVLKPLNIKPTSFPSWKDFIEDKESLSGIIETPIDIGCLLDEANIALITETELFGQQVKQRRRRKTSQDPTDVLIKSLTELNIGSPVVHIDHGVGRYLGLQTIIVDEQANEFLTLEYADKAKLYVPVTHLHLINRYAGNNEALAPLHKLGSDRWQKAKDKAAREVRDVAAELLDIYARRDAREGHIFKFNEADYQRFAASFPFEETPDQESTIEAVIGDMRSTRPMDRLVCGDVGFGKTEVAMRAAFIATTAGKQVAVLVPTTLLAQQHYDNFCDRFADWPVNIDMVSRFKTPKEVKVIEAKIALGQIDILIGTHKILNSDFSFKSLGLLIIDEEHRFGVRQKEAVKSLRSEVDILTLTATPIPRTLNMAMHGIRDLSIIATPPARRLSVKTFVRPHDENLIKEAVLREILRGGQVYFLHNDVKTIEKTARDLRDLIPEARVAVAHGQLRERALEHIMSDFYHQRFNILVCSTIIETGIDVPNANTIIIERADKFGLAQLHQLRGRVGRSHHQAYAYLLTPPPKVMTADAEKRLEAISNATDLGAGFMLATQDLEIRGAGELLGDDQSGQMHTIGFTLYMDMLKQTVNALKSGKQVEDIKLQADNIDINLHIPALIPDKYIPDVHTRLSLYKRLSAISEQKDFREIQVEMIDRFGLLPDEVNYLIAVTQIKLQSEKMGITKIDANDRQGKIDFSADPNVDPLTIIKLVQNQPQDYQLRGANQLLFKSAMHSADDRIETVQELLNHLNVKDNEASK
ncbi:MAG: transcription-repair coupling factor (superfamily II helicase) [Cellvibrionaceae bacterium]|jgi:transcription-repair coupling factor (superfamily II helicase)